MAIMMDNRDLQIVRYKERLEELQLQMPVIAVLQARIEELKAFILDVDENWHNYSDLRYDEKVKEMLGKDL